MVADRRSPLPSVKRQKAPEEPISGLGRDILEYFGARHKEVRTEAGLTQSKVVAKRAGGEGQSYISKIEQGKINLTIMTMVRLAEDLGVTFYDLFPLETPRKRRR